MFFYIHIRLQFQIWTVCLLVCLFSDKTSLTKPLQHRQGLAFQMSGCTVPVLGHPLIWHEATNLLWYDIHVLFLVSSQGDTTTELSWGSQLRVLELGGSKAEFQRGNPICRQMKPGGLPWWDSAADSMAPTPTAIVQSLTRSAQTQSLLLHTWWRVFSVWRRTP